MLLSGKSNIAMANTQKVKYHQKIWKGKMMDVLTLWSMFHDDVKFTEVKLISEHPGDEILHQILQRQTHSQTADATHRQHRAQLHVDKT